MAWTKASIQIALFSLALSMEMVASAGLARGPLTVNTIAQLGDRTSSLQLSDIQPSAELISQNQGAGNNQRPTGGWNAFDPPDRGVPGRREGGGTRGPQCPTSTTALIPQSTMGRTVLAKPTFLYYVPMAIDKKVEFELTDESENPIYKTTLRMITKAPGIVSVNLPAENLASLESGKSYHWYFTIRCNPEDNEANMVVSGWINRVSMTPELTSLLDKAKSDRDRLSIYAKESLWYEYLSTLASLRRSQPNDSALTVKWIELLNAVELENIAEQPLVPSELIPVN
jgi:hypothetical protein